MTTILTLMEDYEEIIKRMQGKVKEYNELYTFIQVDLNTYDVKIAEDSCHNRRVYFSFNYHDDVNIVVNYDSKIFFTCNGKSTTVALSKTGVGFNYKLLNNLYSLFKELKILV